MLITQGIPHLVNGVSQQPSSLRLPSQSEAQENAYSSIVEGLKRRAPTHYVARVINGTLDEAFMHTINRDTSERYKVIITDGDIQVFDLEGNEKSVDIVDNDGYLDATTPSESFHAVSIADYTVVLNSEVTARVGDITASPASGANFYYTQIKNNTNATVYHGYVNLPAGTVSNTGNFTWNGTPLEWDYTVPNTSTTKSQVATGIKNAMLTAGSARHIEEFIGGFTENDVWYVAPKREVSANTEFPLLDYRLSANGTIIPVRDTGEPPIANLTVPTGDADIYGKTETITTVVFIKQGNYGMAYTIDILNGFVAVTKNTSTTDVTDISTAKIAADLNTALNANTDFTTNFVSFQSGSLIKIVSKPYSAFFAQAGTVHPYAIVTSDGNGNRNMVALKESTQKFSNLPESCFNGFKIKVTGDAQSGTDDFYVTFSGGSEFTAGEGSWEESAKDQPSSVYRAETMPHILVRQADGTFKFSQAEWEARPAGDADSNPAASFVDRTITDLFFFRNRLGFLSDDNVIMSCAGDYFNFWRTTVQTLLDGDVIDTAATSTSVAILWHAVPHDKKLVLFSDQQQFILDPGDLLTPKTAAIKDTTKYETVRHCKPIVSGKNLYFIVPRGEEFAGMREYQTDEVTAKDDALDVSAHVPAYMPRDPFKMATATNEEIIVVLSKAAPSEFTVYKFYWAPTGDKLQSSWSKWDLGANATILDADFINMDMWLLVQRPDGVYLETVGVDAERRDEDMDYEVMLDRRITEDECTNVAYDANTNLTTWTLPYVEEDDMVIVTRPGGDEPTGSVLTTQRPTNTTMTAFGDFDSQPVFIGRRFDTLYEFSECVAKERTQQGGGGAPILGGRLQVRTMTLTFDRTGYFRVEVTPRGTDATYTYVITGLEVGVMTEIGSAQLMKGIFRFPVNCKSDRATIRIVSNSHLPFRIQSAEWEGDLTLRARRS